MYVSKHTYIHLYVSVCEYIYVCVGGCLGFMAYQPL